MTFHGLRHTRGSRVLKATGNLVLAQKVLAHKSIKTTLRYAHVNADDVRDGPRCERYSAGSPDYHRTVS